MVLHRDEIYFFAYESQIVQEALLKRLLFFPTELRLSNFVENQLTLYVGLFQNPIISIDLCIYPYDFTVRLSYSFM